MILNAENVKCIHFVYIIVYIIYTAMYTLCTFSCIHFVCITSVRDLYKQMIVMSSKDTFPARFPNIFVNYPLGQMCVGDKLWTHWNKAPMQLWQTQLNFAV